MTTCFVIVLFQNTREEVAKILGALSPSRVYLVDNSGDSDYRVPKNVRLIRTGKNLGYAGGINRALEIIGNSCDWITVLNVDLTFSKNAVQKYVRELSRTPSGIAGIYPGYLDQKRWTTIVPETPSSSRLPDYVSGSFWSFHRDVVHRIGFLPEDYFLYYEEVDYCIRAVRAGFPITLIKNIPVTHHDATGLGKGTSSHQYYLARNHLYFVLRCAPISVKIREMMRIPKTLYDHRRLGESGAVEGIVDFFKGRTGKRGGGV